MRKSATDSYWAANTAIHAQNQLLSLSPVIAKAASHATPTGVEFDALGVMRMSDELVAVTREGAVALLTINRPDKLNALDQPTLEALERAVDAADKDPAVHAILITGAGRAFVAGGDIADLESRRGLAHYLEFAEVIHRVFRRIETCAVISTAATFSNTIAALPWPKSVN